MLVVPYARAWPWAGFSSLTGTAAIAGSPDTPVARRVQMFTAELLPQHVSTMFSVDGVWSVEGIAPISSGYLALGYDDTGVYDPVAKTGLVPTPMAPDPTEHV